MKYFECLPFDISKVICQLDNVCEIRLRNNSYAKVKSGARWFFVGASGLQSNVSGALMVNNVYSVVESACENSVFAYEDMLSQGYFTFEDGARMGICGDATVASNGKLYFKSISSVCIRIPHFVHCVSNAVFHKLKGYNVLVVGSPGAGKTTFLRNFATKLSDLLNVLIVDQRGEIDIGSCEKCDVLKWTSKQYAIDVGVRSLCPDYVVFDEVLVEENNVIGVCLQSGVNVVASIHGRKLEDIKKLQCYNLFQRIVVLDNNYCYQIFDENGKIV